MTSPIRTTPVTSAGASPTGGDAPTLSSAAAQSWFCARLPVLRRRADREGWRERLEAEVRANRQGRPALESMRNLALDPVGTHRNGSPLAFDDMWESSPAEVQYRCTRFICSDRGRNEDATEPWCHVEDGPLLPATSASGS